MRLTEAMLVRKSCGALAAAIITALLTLSILPAEAGFMFHQQNRRDVGGVLIDTEGVLHALEPSKELLNDVVEARRKALEPIADQLKAEAPMRKISLKQLFADVKRHHETSIEELPQELLYLGGLQRVQYVFVYPDDNDIVIAGPAEGWVVNDRADTVGETTGLPVLHLEDLIVAMRSAFAPQPQPISCSIDPRPEGIQKLRAFLAEKAKERDGLGPNPEKTLLEIEELLGPQIISVEGVPDTCRFARVLVGADYQMKRIAMGLQESPIRGLSSYLNMVRSPRNSQMMPRWWLAPKYDAIAVSEDGLAFELRGPGVQAMTEDELVTAEGERTATGKANPVAKNWADTFTEKYPELCKEETTFGMLRNCIDLAVIAALVRKHNLAEVAQFDMEYILDGDKLLLTAYNPPRTVPTQASAVKRGRNWIVSASGGVDVNPWPIVEKDVKVPELSKTRDDAIPPAGAGWIWN